MKNIFIVFTIILFLLSCINAEIDNNPSDTKYSLKLSVESNDLVVTAIPGDNVKFSLSVQGVAPLKSMVFYADEIFFDISGIQNKTPPYKVDITSFIIDKNSPEKTILCKVVAKTMDGMFVTSNVIPVKVLDMKPPEIIKFEKDQSPVDSIVSDSPFSILVEAQDLNTGIGKVELFDANNLIATKYSDNISEKYFSRRYNFVAPKMNCGVVQMVLRVYDNSYQQNFVEKVLLLKINGHPFDEDAPVLSFLSPSQNSNVSIGEKIDITVKAEDDCSLVDKIYYFTSFDQQVYTIDVVNKKRVVEEMFNITVPDSLKDGEEFSIYSWADDTNNPKHGSKDNAVELKLVALGRDIPVVYISSPSDNTSVNVGDKISITGNAISNRYQIKEISLRMSGSYTETRKSIISPPQASATFNFDFTIPSTLKSGDQIVIYVDAKDNSSSETIGTAGPVRLNVVSKRPEVQIISPSEGTVFYPSGTISTVVFAQSENQPITSIFYHIEGIEGISVDDTYVLSSPQKSFSKTFTYKLPDDVSEGQLVITASALDKDNAKGEANPVTVKVVDNIKPIASVTSPAYNSYVDAGSTFDLIVKAEDKNSMVAEIDASVISPYTDSKKLLINKKSDEVTFTFTVPDNLVSNQIITIQVYAIDDSSMSNRSEVVQWRLRVR